MPHENGFWEVAVGPEQTNQMTFTECSLTFTRWTWLRLRALWEAGRWAREGYRRTIHLAAVDYQSGIDRMAATEIRFSDSAVVVAKWTGSQQQ